MSEASSDSVEASEAGSGSVFRAELASYNDQLIRQTRVHHVQLTMMADTKANILLTISSVLVTLTAAHLRDDMYRWPATVLTTGCAFSAMFAALTVMPKFFRGKLVDGVTKKETVHLNPLFFADFTRLSYPEFLQTMERAMSSSSAAYEVQLREIYTLGSFLARSKYRWLRLGYFSFLGAVGGSLITWLIQVARF